MTTDLALLVDGIGFGEAPRWHDGRLWYSDFRQRAICAVTPDGDRVVVHGDLDDQPSGLGWTPQGDLLAVAMTSHRLWRSEGGALVDHADLSSIATGPCNDMVVDASGNAYVGNFGFDLDGGKPRALADLALVRLDGTAAVVASDLSFPNGSLLSADGRTLIVAETFGRRFSAFDVAADATLSNRRVWAETPEMAPDGCTMDAEGAIWFADAAGSCVVRILEGGLVTHRITTPMSVYACMLGGQDGTTLFIVCSPGSRDTGLSSNASGMILTTEVDIGRGDGRP